jgi:hypothetical protein
MSVSKYIIVVAWIGIWVTTTVIFAGRVPAEQRYVGQGQVTFVLQSGESFDQETTVTRLTSYADSHFIILCEHGEVIESRLQQAPLELNWVGDYHATKPEEVHTVYQGLCSPKEGYNINVTLTSEGEVAMRLLFYEGRVEAIKILYWVTGIIIMAVGLWWYLSGSQKDK